MALHTFRSTQYELQYPKLQHCLDYPSTMTGKHHSPAHRYVALPVRAYVTDHYWYFAIPLVYKFLQYRFYRYLVTFSWSQGLPSRGELLYVRGQVITTIPHRQQQRHLFPRRSLLQLNPKIRSQQQPKVIVNINYCYIHV